MLALLAAHPVLNPTKINMTHIIQGLKNRLRFVFAMFLVLFKIECIAVKVVIVRECKLIINNMKHKTMQNTINQNEINMLRTELELLMLERDSLLRVTGAAAGLIAEMDSHDLSIRTIEAADLLATTINRLSEESFQDALSAVNAEIIG
jgi:hypothetical protein